LFTEDPPNRPMGSQKQSKASKHLFTEDPPNLPMAQTDSTQPLAAIFFLTEDPPNRSHPDVNIERLEAVLSGHAVAHGI